MHCQISQVVRIVAGLLLVLTSCSSGEPIHTERTVTIDEATERGFPLYLPSSKLVQAMNLDFPPIITLEERGSPLDEICASLTIEFYRREREKNPVVTMRVSNGCAFPTLLRPIEQVSLEWARYSTVGILESSEEHTILCFSEPGSFLYVIFSGEPLTPTLEFLESMEYVQ